MTKWRHLGYEQFNQTDLGANIAVQQGTDNMRYGVVENLCESDGYTLVWRNLASKYNRGVQKRQGIT